MIIKINRINNEMFMKLPSLLEEYKRLTVKINHFDYPLNFVVEKHFNEKNKLIIARFDNEDLEPAVELGVFEFMGKFFFMESGADCDVEIETPDV